MVEYASTPPEEDPLAPVFLALADSTRRKLVHLLAERERTVGELAAPFDISLAAISKHLQVLERAGLVERRVDGRTHYCSLKPEALAGALDWISIYRFNCRRIDRFVHGRVIFVGDSAHQVSPFGARGANSGVQDAENLAWKLAAVLTLLPRPCRRDRRNAGPT